MIKLEESKLAALYTASELLDSKYGPEGTNSRREFEVKAHSYYTTILEDKQKNVRKIQTELIKKT